MTSQSSRSPFDFDMSAIQRLELLRSRPPFRRGLVRKLGLRGLHCGCGLNLFPGWLNTDLFHLTDPRGNGSSTNRIACVNGELYYVEHDANERLPFESRSFDWVYSEHFIEHLEHRAAISWLKEARRVLKPDGLLRLTTPDLARYIKGYLDRDQRFYAEHRKRISHLFADGAPARRAWMMNQIFYSWEHRWLYDFDEIVHAATRAGFAPASVTQSSFRQGRVPDVWQLDWDFRNDETLYVEMIKTSTPRSAKSR